MVYTVAQSIDAAFPLNATHLLCRLDREESRCPQLDKPRLNLTVRRGTFVMKDVADESWAAPKFTGQATYDSRITSKPVGFLEPCVIPCSWQRVIFVHAPKVYVHWYQETRHKSTFFY